MPKKIRELKVILSRAGFILLKKRGKGSHSRWYHPVLNYRITLSGKDGSDAKSYQEKEVQNVIMMLEALNQEDEQ
jgi:predicted RNA binding protein YcfA (HicA-like mRNA interferase family)